MCVDGAAPLHKIGVVLAPCWVGPPKKFLHRVVFLVKWQLRMGAEFQFCKVGPKLCHAIVQLFPVMAHGKLFNLYPSEEKYNQHRMTQVSWISN